MKWLLAGSCFTLLNLATAQAATELPSGPIPEELIQEFGGGGQFRTTLPDDFPLTSLSVNVDLHVIGSMQSAAASDVLLSSAASAAVVIDAVAPALLENDWQVLATSGGASNRYATLCHDTFGALALNAHDTIDGSRLSLRLTQLPSTTSCAAEQCNQELRSVGPAVMNEISPILALPDGALSGGWTPGYSDNLFAPTSRYETSRQASLRMPDTSAATLYSQLAVQLVAQGWHQNSANSGSGTAGGLWLSQFVPKPGIDFGFDGEPPAPIDLYGTLTVLDLGEDRYTIGWSLQTGNL
jgi:hypothetical protein